MYYLPAKSSNVKVQEVSSILRANTAWDLLENGLLEVAAVLLLEDPLETKLHSWSPV